MVESMNGLLETRDLHHIRCLAHVIHLAVTAALEPSKIVLSKVRAAVLSLHGSPQI